MPFSATASLSVNFFQRTEANKQARPSTPSTTCKRRLRLIWMQCPRARRHSRDNEMKKPRVYFSSLSCSPPNESHPPRAAPTRSRHVTQMNACVRACARYVTKRTRIDATLGSASPTDVSAPHRCGQKVRPSVSSLGPAAQRIRSRQSTALPRLPEAAGGRPTDAGVESRYFARIRELKKKKKKHVFSVICQLRVVERDVYAVGLLRLCGRLRSARLEKRATLSSMKLMKLMNHWHVLEVIVLQE